MKTKEPKVEKSSFRFLRTKAMVKAKVNLAIDDALINYTTDETMMMNEESDLPWRGPREKDARFIQYIIEGTTVEGDVVLDCTASVGRFTLTSFESLFNGIVEEFVKQQ